MAAVYSSGLDSMPTKDRTKRPVRTKERTKKRQQQQEQEEEEQVEVMEEEKHGYYKAVDCGCGAQQVGVRDLCTASCLVNIIVSKATHHLQRPYIPKTYIGRYAGTVA